MDILDYLLQKVNNFAVGQKVNTSAREERSILIPVFEGGLLGDGRGSISLVLGTLAFLLADHKSVFEILHND